MILKSLKKKWNCWLRLLRNYKLNSSKEKISEIPKEVADDERILRTIFSPINLNNSKTKISPNAFKSPAGKDEVSVNRFDFTTEDFCKSFSKKIQNPSAGRTYFGFGALKASAIRSTEAWIEYSPILANPQNLFHSDIKIGFVKEHGQPLPAEYNFKVKKMTEAAILYSDPDPDAIEWTGEKIE